eukprot:7044264-Heterocapsa_arctica.AAC.1
MQGQNKCCFAEAKHHVVCLTTELTRRRNAHFQHVGTIGRISDRRSSATERVESATRPGRISDRQRARPRLISATKTGRFSNWQRARQRQISATTKG